MKSDVAGTESPARRESALQRKLTLGDVLDLPSFNEVVKSFVQLHKIGIKVFDDRGQKLADLKEGNGDFCGYVFSFPEGRSRCIATVARVKDGPIALSHGACPASLGELNSQTAKGMVAVPCFTGLRYLILPITWEGDSLGRIVFGPFTPEDLGELPPSLREISNGLELSLAHTHLEKIRRAPESTIAKVMLHFLQLLETLIAVGQKTYFTSQIHIEATLETNRELENKNKRLRELDKLKSSFLATVSHELRTPLTSIIGYSEMLSEGMVGPLNTEQLDYVRTIADKGDSLLRLINSLLDLSQIEAGKVRLTFAPLDVRDVVRQAVSSVRPQSQKKGLSLEMLVPESTRVQAIADREKLLQVFVNLLANAVKFTPQGGRVGVSLSEALLDPVLGRESYSVIVEDSGHGIPSEQQVHIFESFFQVDGSSTREFGGAGLGLAIVKGYVEGHGGKVQVTSEAGKGARFTVLLPTSPPARSAQIAPPVSPDRF
jgi:signal transduction histidine kinase